MTNIKMGQLYLSTSHLLVLKFEKYQNWGLLSHSFLVWTTICQLTKFKHSKISKVEFVFNISLILSWFELLFVSWQNSSIQRLVKWSLFSTSCYKTFLTIPRVMWNLNFNSLTVVFITKKLNEWFSFKAIGKSLAYKY